MRRDFMFTSESVTEGHPDKLCDQISDAIVDHLLIQDPYARVRAESAVSSAIIFIAARFETSAKIDLAHVARKVIKLIGYDQPDFNSKSCSIITAPKGFPPDEQAQFNEYDLSDEEIERIMAKNQVTLFGFACNQTLNFLPLPIMLAHKLSRQLSDVRRSGRLPYLMPDGKVQVGVEYHDRKPQRIHSITVTASQAHPDTPDQAKLHDDIVQTVVTPVFVGMEISPDPETRIFINPDGPFLGGPTFHSGLTGRKSAVDTYGEYARHSGDALSGKDPMRIDRIGAYAARYAAKNVVGAGLASECEVTLSYSIGITRPVSLNVETFGTGRIPDEKISEIVKSNFDFRLAAILRQFGLRHLPRANPMGFYQKLAANGHVGRIDMDLPWEKMDKVDDLIRAADS